MLHDAGHIVSMRIVGTEYYDVVLGCGENERAGPSGLERAPVREPPVRGPAFPAVVSHPVAGYYDAAVSKCKGRRKTAFVRHDAGRRKGVRCRVINFSAPALSYAEILRASTANQDAAVSELRRKTVRMRIEHRHCVPCSVGIVFRRLQRLVPLSMPAEHQNFLAEDHRPVISPGHIQVRQPLHRHLLPLRPVRRRDRAPARLRRRAAGQDCSGGQSYEQRMFHVFENKNYFLKERISPSNRSSIESSVAGRPRIKVTAFPPSGINFSFSAAS